MDAFCPNCGANVGFGTIAIIGCPLCGYGEDEELDDEDIDNDEFDDELEEKESRRKVSVRSRTSHRTRPRTSTKKKPAKKG